MCVVKNKEDYNEKLYQEFQETLKDEKVEIELIKCKCCGDEVEESEIEYCVFHDLNDNKELLYCATCIEEYKQEIL